MQKLLCEEATVKCRLLNCELCPPLGNFEDYIIDLLRGKNVMNVTYKNWVSTDRTNMILVTDTTESFAIKFGEKLNSLITHHFVAKSQAAEFERQKNNLKPGEILLHWDFSENLIHSLQDSVQSEYWSATQSTIHPCVMYFLNENNVLDHKSFAFISPCLDHGSQFVRVVQTKLINHVKTFIPNLKKVYYWSDGCAAQYKNKYMFYWIAKHIKDFGVSAEYNFFATAHGKGAVDGVGAVVKRLIRLESLTPREGVIVNDSKTAFDFLKTSGSTVEIFYVTEGEVNKIVKPQKAIAVAGTRKFHSIKIQTEQPMQLCFREVANAEECLLITYHGLTN